MFLLQPIFSFSVTCSLRDFTSFQWGLAVTVKIYLYGAVRQQKVKYKKEKKFTREKVRKICYKGLRPVCVKMCSPYTEQGNFFH